MTIDFQTPAVQEIFTTVEQIKKTGEKEGWSTIPSVSQEFGHDLRDPREQSGVLWELVEKGHICWCWRFLARCGQVYRTSPRVDPSPGFAEKQEGNC